MFRALSAAPGAAFRRGTPDTRSSPPAPPSYPGPVRLTILRPPEATTSGSANADLSDGWGVEVVPKPGLRPSRNSKEGGALQNDSVMQVDKIAVRSKKDKTIKEKGHREKKSRLPYVDMRTDGLQTLAALRTTLDETGSAELSSEERLALQRDANESIKRRKKKGPEGNVLTRQITKAASEFMKKSDEATAARNKGRTVVMYDDDGRSWTAEEDLVESTPSFSIAFDDKEAVFEGFDDDEDEENSDEEDLNFFDDEDDFDFTDKGSSDGWGALDQVAPKRRKAGAQEINERMGGDMAQGMAALEGEDLVLEEFAGMGGPSLMEELGVVPRRDGSVNNERDAFGIGLDAQWGGTGASSGNIDFDAQEAILNRIFKPHKVKQLMEYQREAVEEAKKRHAKPLKNPKLQSVLRIAGGTHANRPIMSSLGKQTRPMMEKVRQAIFNMIQSQSGSVSCLPEGSRWLDLFAGTGSVGLEALSRGSGEVHFVEMDKWLCKNVLGRNLTTLGFQRKAVVHTFKCEDFLRKALELPRFAGGAFDFISMCPPYLLVSYPELFHLLEKSPLIHPGTILFVEYPKQLSDEIPATLGPLVQVRDRKYGRTRVVVYGPADHDSEDEEETLAL